MNLRLILHSFRSTPFCIVSFALAVIGTTTLVLALSSPYWLESKPELDSSFVRLGLWNICFRRYQHPSLEYDSVLDGCYSLHGHQAETLRNVLQPGWFVFVQCLTTCGTLLSGLCLCILIFMHLQNEMEIKIFVSAFVVVLEALSALLAFLGVCVFGAMAFERSWIQYPKYNMLSYGFGFAIIGFLSLGFGAVALFAQTFHMRKLLYRNNTIMYHIPTSNM